MTRYLVILFAAVLMVGCIGLLLVVQYQIGTIEAIEEQNGLLWEYVAVQGRLCHDLEVVVGRLLGSVTRVAGWLGMKPQEGLGGPVSRKGVP